MKAKSIKKPLLILLPLIVVGVLVLSVGVFWGMEEVYDRKRQGMKQENIKVEDIKIGDCVQCIWGSEDTVVKDRKEYGPPTKSERIAMGIVTDIQNGEVYVRLESIADFFYIKKISSWIPDLSVKKPPPYLKGDIYKCKSQQIKEVEDGLVATKIYNSIKKIPCK